MSMRLAVKSDQAALVQCAQQSYEHYIERIGRKPAPMLMDFEAEISAGKVSVWETETGVVVAYVVMECSCEAVFLEAMGVLPSHQGQGIGRQLVAWCEQMAQTTTLRKVCLYTNVKMVENIAMYTKWGYVEVDRRQEDGFERVYFEKTMP